MKLLAIAFLVIYYCRCYDAAVAAGIVANGNNHTDNNLLEICAPMPVQHIADATPVAALVSRTSVAIPVYGFVNDPQSRAYKCKLNINKNCGNVKYEPQSAEMPKGFPDGGPVDGKIAGGSRFPQLDQYGADRWVHEDISHLVQGINETHVTITLNWYYTAVHKTSGYHLYGTVNDYDETNEPIKRSNLQHLDTYRRSGTGVAERVKHTFQKDKLNKRGVLLSIWDIADTSMAFYQVIDYTYDGASVLPTPSPLPPSTTTTTKPGVNPGCEPCEPCDSHESPSLPAPTLPSCGIKTDHCYDAERLCEQYYAPSLCNCHQFYQFGGVRGGQVWLQECLGDLVFNDDVNVCDWRFNVNVDNVPCPNVV